MGDIKETYEVYKVNFDRDGEWADAQECCPKGSAFTELQEAIIHAKKHLADRDGYRFEVIDDRANVSFTCQSDYEPDYYDEEDKAYDSWSDKQIERGSQNEQQS